MFKKTILIIIEFIENLFKRTNMAKPQSIVSNSPLSKPPFNSRIVLPSGTLSPNPIQGDVRQPIPTNEISFEEKYNKVFNYLISRYEPTWTNVSDEQGKLATISALGVQESKNPFDGSDPIADQLFRYTTINPTGYFDIFTNPKNFASAVHSQYSPYERSRNPEQANHRFVEKYFAGIATQSVYYYEGGGAAAFSNLAPSFRWWPDTLNPNEIHSKCLTLNPSKLIENKIERANIHTPYGAFKSPMYTGVGLWATIGRQRGYPWLTNRYTGDDWRYDQYLLTKESTTIRDLLPDPVNTSRDASLGILVDGVADSKLNDLHRDLSFPVGTVPFPIDYNGNNHNNGGYPYAIKVGPAFLPFPTGITWNGGWWSGEGITLNFNIETMVLNNGQSINSRPNLVDTTFNPSGIPFNYWNKFTGFRGLSYGYFQANLDSLNQLSLDWGDKIEFIAHLGGMHGMPRVPDNLYLDPTVPENVRYMKWRFNAAVSHWKEKFKSPIDGFAHVFFDASILTERTYHTFKGPDYLTWDNVLPSGVSFVENIPFSWAKDQYNYTRGISSPNPDKGVLFGVERHSVFYSFKWENRQSEQQRFKNDPAPMHWCNDDDAAPDLYSSSFDLLCAQRKYGRDYVESIWKSNGRKKLGEILSHENPEVNNEFLDVYPFYYQTFIEHDGTSLKWKKVQGTKYGNYNDPAATGVPWNQDRRFRLFYHFPLMLALNATIVDYMHSGLGYCAMPYQSTQPSGWFDVRLGTDFVEGMENKPYPFVSSDPFPRKTPITPPQNYWTGSYESSEFELLYACMKGGITMGLDSLGFTNLYDQLP